MTRSLVVYATDFPKVVSAVGSQDGDIFERCQRPEDDPSLVLALEELVMRKDRKYAQPASWLAFAQERLCDAHGRALPNSSVAGVSLGRIEELDAALASYGLGVTLFDLMYGGGPIKGLPWPDDFPSTGSWDPEEVATALGVYRGVAPTSEDPDVDQLLVELGGWLEVAEAGRQGLVGFYY